MTYISTTTRLPYIGKRSYFAQNNVPRKVTGLAPTNDLKTCLHPPFIYHEGFSDEGFSSRHPSLGKIKTSDILFCFFVKPICSVQRCEAVNTVGLSSGASNWLHPPPPVFPAERFYTQRNPKKSLKSGICYAKEVVYTRQPSVAVIRVGRRVPCTHLSP